ncbi:hypothetical protein PBOI14_32710 [Pseudomonas sp. Boi14]|nr:hypothetical protein PBOI14_32710 [Pseudomonas sp. Boi14]
MSLKPLLLLPGLGLVCLLSACAGPLPKADPQQAWIDLAPESPNDLLADSVDGKRLNDGRYFQVSPGQHRLRMALLKGANGNSAQPDCLGRLDYAGFQAGAITDWWSPARARTSAPNCWTPRAGRWPRAGRSVACRAFFSIAKVDFHDTQTAAADTRPGPRVPARRLRRAHAPA